MALCGTEHKVGNGIWYTLLFSIFTLYFIFQVVVKVSLKQSFIRMNWFYIGLGFLALFLIWLAKAFRMYSIGRGMGIKDSIFLLSTTVFSNLLYFPCYSV